MLIDSTKLSLAKGYCLWIRTLIMLLCCVFRSIFNS